MQTADRWSTSLSVLALAVSIVSPFATYEWLQNSVREQHLAATALRATGPYTTDLDPDDLNKSLITFYVDVENVGKVPIEDVRINVRYYRRRLLPSDLGTREIYPPIQYTVEQIDSSSYAVVLASSVVPGAHVTVPITRFLMHPDSVSAQPLPSAWVQTKASNVEVNWYSSGVGI